jgi:hypothetical protein
MYKYKAGDVLWHKLGNSMLVVERKRNSYNERVEYYCRYRTEKGELSREWFYEEEFVGKASQRGNRDLS